MPPDRHRRPGAAETVNRSAEAFVVEHTTKAEATATAGAPTYDWRQCDEHPWYGVSVIVTGKSALCVPPLDGPNHWVVAP